MHPKSALSFATLVLGTALTAIPAFAQDTYPSGRTPNDGGFVQIQGDTYGSNGSPVGQGGYQGGYYNAAPGWGSGQNAAPAGDTYAPGSDQFSQGQGPYYDYEAGPSAGPMAGPTAGAMSGRAAAFCQTRFRSYDPSSGTYLGFDGDRHPCP